MLSRETNNGLPCYMSKGNTSRLQAVHKYEKALQINNYSNREYYTPKETSWRELSKGRKYKLSKVFKEEQELTENTLSDILNQ